MKSLKAGGIVGHVQADRTGRQVAFRRHNLISTRLGP